ncbi:hypothetical protein AC1031_016545 [Aphanomyces cochlioides]|nr:hypothetical protein AC1031_016545 [Aphanomyces cochlioides]
MIHSFSAPTGCKSIKLVLTKPKLITLPIEAIIKIVFAIPDAKDLFAFLEALRPHIDLGPLDNLYSLSLAHEHEVFWPKLYLEPSILDSIDRSAFEALARHYPIVRVRNVWQDAAWLKSHLKPTAKITWDIENYPAVINIEDDWSNLRITRLKVAMVENLPFCWDIALSKLPLLTSLGVYKDCTDLGDLFKIMATSKQITEFSLLVDSYVIVDSDLIYLTEWFRHQQARKLEMWPNITKAPVIVRQSGRH